MTALLTAVEQAPLVAGGWLDPSPDQNNCVQEQYPVAPELVLIVMGIQLPQLFASFDSGTEPTIEALASAHARM
jgi:hypothetical protein